MKKTLLKLLERFNSYTETNPARSIIVSTGLILGTGDLVTQTIERRKAQKSENTDISPPYNKSRAFHMALYGFAFLGPFSYYWYLKLLPRLAPVTNLNSNWQIIKKTLIDQIVSPCIQYPSFLISMTLLSGKSLLEEKHKITKDFIQCFISDCAFWPLVMFFNFRYIPIYLQPIAINTLSVFWNAYISSIFNKPPQKQHLNFPSQTEILKTTLVTQ